MENGSIELKEYTVAVEQMDELIRLFGVFDENLKDCHRHRFLPVIAR